MRALVLQSTALLMALAASSAAALDPVAPAAPDGAPDAPAVAASAPAVAAAAPTDATAPVYDGAGRRDPFRPFTLDVRTDHPQVTPLQRYELGELTVVGTVWEVQTPRAMVEDSVGMGYIVAVGTPIGRNGGIVAAIEPRQVIVEERGLDFYGNEQVRRIVMETPKEGTPSQVARGPK